DFDLAKIVEQSRDNPVFYVQYGHARGKSVFRNARQVLPDLPEADADLRNFLAQAPVERLTEEGELAILKRIALYPRTLEAAAAAHEPHRVAFYLFLLPSDFPATWTRAYALPPFRFIFQNHPHLTRPAL